MASATPIPAPESTKVNSRVIVKSYDTGYEHSVEHWFDLRGVVEEEQREAELTD